MTVGRNATTIPNTLGPNNKFRVLNGLGKSAQIRFGQCLTKGNCTSKQDRLSGLSYSAPCKLAWIVIIYDTFRTQFSLSLSLSIAFSLLSLSLSLSLSPLAVRRSFNFHKDQVAKYHRLSHGVIIESNLLHSSLASRRGDSIGEHTNRARLPHVIQRQTNRQQTEGQTGFRETNRHQTA